MKRLVWLRRATVGILLVLVLAGGYWVGSSPRRRAESISVLTIEPADLDFGLVWEDPGFVWKVSVYNRSDRPVKIAEFVPSCPALVIEPASLTVPAGGSAEIRLRIDLTKSSAGCCGCDSKQTTTDSSSQGQD